jgi:hypothetical protein
MKRIKLKMAAIVVCSLLAVSSFSQDWDTAGNTVLGGEWLGTQNNQPLSIRTNNTERMRLWQSNVVTLNAGTSNAAAINQGGFLGIGQHLNFFSGAFAVGPYSLLHLNGAGSLGAGNSASRISLGLNGENNLAWSMLHLWGKTLG